MEGTAGGGGGGRKGREAWEERKQLWSLSLGVGHGAGGKPRLGEGGGTAMREKVGCWCG